MIIKIIFKKSLPVNMDYRPKQMIVKYNGNLGNRQKKRDRYLLRKYLSTPKFYKTPSIPSTPGPNQIVPYSTAQNDYIVKFTYDYKTVNALANAAKFEGCFIFTRPRPTSQTIIASFPKINELDNLEYSITSMTDLNEKLSSLRTLETLYYELRTYYASHMIVSIYSPFERGPFSADIDRIKEQIKEISRQLDPEVDKFYRRIVKMSYEEQVNGYNLYDVDKNIMDYDTYCKLLPIWNDKTAYTHEEFMEKYNDEACTDWSKQDRHGNCFGGFWEYEEGTYERENAYQLSRKDNGQGLWELPDSHNFIFKTIELGCRNRMESVRYSNFLCEWMARKNRLMRANVKSLKDICITYVKQNQIEIKDISADLIDDINDFTPY